MSFLCSQLSNVLSSPSEQNQSPFKGSKQLASIILLYTLHLITYYSFLDSLPCNPSDLLLAPWTRPTPTAGPLHLLHLVWNSLPHISPWIATLFSTLCANITCSASLSLPLFYLKLQHSHLSTTCPLCLPYFTL